HEPYRRQRQMCIRDRFQAVPVFSETRNVHTAESLLGAILSKLPLDEEGMDPELLRKGWMAAAGPFLGKQACLVSLVKGVATIQVLQPAMNYHLQQWQGALLGKLRDQFGKDAVHSIRIRIG
ncbi:DciA family protein, partial [uncultured Akkermansia sp.]|uniref:DciA family protein n=1 Tax=uncultured Akkermansia sp. TaxID=512294 RepID=UPI002599142E